MVAINTVEVMDRPLGVSDTRSDLELALQELGVKDAKAFSTFMYTLAGDHDKAAMRSAASLMFHRVTQEAFVNQPITTGRQWSFAIRVDYKPGVTDNAARVLRSDLGLVGIPEAEVYSSQVHYVRGTYDDKLRQGLERLASNPLIHDITIISHTDFDAQGGFAKKIHPVQLDKRPNFFWVDVGSMDRDELLRTGSLGTLNTDRTVNPKQRRGGELALEEDFMFAIQKYANSDLNTQAQNGTRRKGFLTDTELEWFGQDWSEHCRHTIYNALIPGENVGIFEKFISGPTLKVLQEKPYLGVTVFRDNSGGFRFNDDWIALIKNETHNSPSALDPFGGAITGIVGVYRDPAGTGLGGEVIGGFLFYYFGHLNDTRKYYKARLGHVGSIVLPESVILDLGLESKVSHWINGTSGQERTSTFTDMWLPEAVLKQLKLADGINLWKPNESTLILNPRQIDRGVNKGVETGGNCSGQPIYLGTRQHHDVYYGKPQVGVGALGRLPFKIGNLFAHEKHIDIEDRLYIIGGRAGLDGIHGATFSSKGLTSSSSPTAVQIGDPYTQKKMFDALLELRDLGYIKFITDLGAGGVACASIEMARETNGLEIDLDKLLVKYPGMTATELLFNESQERMAIAVDMRHKDDIEAILKKHEVEFSDIGKFTASGRAIVYCKGDTVADLDMGFLHKGYPRRNLKFADYKPTAAEAETMQARLDETVRIEVGETREYASPEKIREEFRRMLARPNFGSVAPFMDRMDSTVKGLWVQHCIQGRGRISTKAACSLIDNADPSAVIQAYGFCERQSYIDSKQMGINAFLRAIGNSVAMGGDIDYMIATDQALWQSGYDPKFQRMLYEANEGMASIIIGCKIPVISGKDSMFNQATIYDEKGNVVKRGVFPTLLMITMSKLNFAGNVMTVDAKHEGDFIYIVGEPTGADFGGSELYNMYGEMRGEILNVGRVSNVPYSNFYETCRRMKAAHDQGILQSARYVEAGGVTIALRDTACAAERGVHVDLGAVHSEQGIGPREKLHGETEGRFIITAKPHDAGAIERRFRNSGCSLIGVVTGDQLRIDSPGYESLVAPRVAGILSEYHAASHPVFLTRRN